MASRVREGEILVAFPAGAKNASYDNNAKHLHKQHLCATSLTGSYHRYACALYNCTAALQLDTSQKTDDITPMAVWNG